MNKNKFAERMLAFWGGSLGFVVGAAAMAIIGKQLGWWPISRRRLQKYANKPNV